MPFHSSLELRSLKIEAISDKGSDFKLRLVQQRRLPQPCPACVCASLFAKGLSLNLCQGWKAIGDFHLWASSHAGRLAQLGQARCTEKRLSFVTKKDDPL